MDPPLSRSYNLMGFLIKWARPPFAQNKVPRGYDLFYHIISTMLPFQEGVAKLPFFKFV